MALEGSEMKRSRVRTAEGSGSVDLMSIAEHVEQFANKRVLLLGDFVADEFRSGEITRVSREAPVLILRHRETHFVPGGGANAANNLAALGAEVLPVTAVGTDPAGDALIAYFKERRVDTSGIVRVKGWTTPTKTRFLAGWAHTVGQQVLRVDYEPKDALPDVARAKIQTLARARMRRTHAVAISDYGFGVTDPEFVRALTTGAKRAELPVTLDARYQLMAYAKAGITAATPNEAELEAQHHAMIGEDMKELSRCGRQTLSAMKLEALLVTRGRDGMVLFERERAGSERVTSFAVHGSRHAVDVTGAGDTVLAAFTLALATGGTPLEAAHIANIAGGLVVMKRGTAIVTRSELLEAIRHEASGAGA
jgi:D-glycero-beta-D-manno-heptose-7-phosphate kinase